MYEKSCLFYETWKKKLELTQKLFLLTTTIYENTPVMNVFILNSGHSCKRFADSIAYSFCAVAMTHV